MKCKRTPFVVIIDYNKYQAMDSLEKIMGLNDFASKLKAFGFSVADIDGGFAVPVKVLSPDKMAMPVGVRRAFAIVILGIIPLVILAVGFMVYLKRRHK